MTTLTVNPDIAKKRLKLTGKVASGEKVSVTVTGFGSASTANLRLRVMAGHVAVGYFPLEDNDSWTVSGSDLTCTLNLSTEQAERICKFGANVCFILEDVGIPQLFGVGDFTLCPWIKLADSDVPVNLDNYKSKIEEISQSIANLQTAINAKYTKPAIGIPKSDLTPSIQTSLDKADLVPFKVSKNTFDTLLGVSLPDSASQKDTRQVVQRILAVLKNAATCVMLAFTLPLLGIDNTTAWEDVPPQFNVKSVVEQFSPPADFSINNARLVETIVATSPTPDLSTNNAELVETIEATAPRPDFTASNSTLVATIHSEAPTPDLSAYATTNDIDYTTGNSTLVSTIEATAPASGNYNAVSNAAMNAASASDLATIRSEVAEKRDYDNLAYFKHEVVNYPQSGIMVVSNETTYSILHPFAKKGVYWVDEDDDGVWDREVTFDYYDWTNSEFKVELGVFYETASGEGWRIDGLWGNTYTMVNPTGVVNGSDYTLYAYRDDTIAMDGEIRNRLDALGAEIANNISTATSGVYSAAVAQAQINAESAYLPMFSNLNSRIDEKADKMYVEYENGDITNHTWYIQPQGIRLYPLGDYTNTVMTYKGMRGTTNAFLRFVGITESPWWQLTLSEADSWSSIGTNTNAAWDAESIHFENINMTAEATRGNVYEQIPVATNVVNYIRLEYDEADGRPVLYAQEEDAND